MQKLLDANPVEGRTVLNIGDLLGLEAGSNPHQWYSPRSVRRVIAAVSADLAKLDPDHRDVYVRRRQAYESTGLGEYNRLLAAIKRRFAGAPIGATESIVAPWAAGAGLDLVTPEKFVDAIAEGNEPTRSDKATVDEQIADRKIKVLVYNSQNATPTCSALSTPRSVSTFPSPRSPRRWFPSTRRSRPGRCASCARLLDVLAASSPS